MRSVVDLNSDLGEGFGAWSFGDDAAMLEAVTSANVACGFHAGDPAIMRRMCADAVARGVRVAAVVEAVRLPRRTTPRTRVPAGSVAIADVFTAVYPWESPGGWHLLGRTDTALWQSHRTPPNLLDPGDRVRFVPRTGR